MWLDRGVKKKKKEILVKSYIVITLRSQNTGCGVQARGAAGWCSAPQALLSNGTLASTLRGARARTSPGAWPRPGRGQHVLAGHLPAPQLPGRRHPKVSPPRGRTGSFSGVRKARDLAAQRFPPPGPIAPKRSPLGTPNTLATPSDGRARPWRFWWPQCPHLPRAPGPASCACAAKKQRDGARRACPAPGAQRARGAAGLPFLLLCLALLTPHALPTGPPRRPRR